MLDLSGYEIHQRRAVTADLADRIDVLRRKNDDPKLDHDQTQELRGKIAALVELHAEWDVDREKPTLKRDPSAPLTKRGYT